MLCQSAFELDSTVSHVVSHGLCAFDVRTLTYLAIAWEKHGARDFTGYHPVRAIRCDALMLNSSSEPRLSGSVGRRASLCIADVAESVLHKPCAMQRGHQ